MDLILLRGEKTAAELPVQLSFWSQEPSLDARLRVQNAALLLLFDALPRVEAALAPEPAPTSPRPALRLLPNPWKV